MQHKRLTGAFRGTMWQDLLNISCIEWAKWAIASSLCGGHREKFVNGDCFRFGEEIEGALA